MAVINAPAEGCRIIVAAKILPRSVAMQTCIRVNGKCLPGMERLSLSNADPYRSVSLRGRYSLALYDAWAEDWSAAPRSVDRRVQLERAETPLYSTGQSAASAPASRQSRPPVVTVLRHGGEEG